MLNLLPHHLQEVGNYQKEREGTEVNDRMDPASPTPPALYFQPGQQERIFKGSGIVRRFNEIHKGPLMMAGVW